MYLLIWWIGADLAKIYISSGVINLRSLTVQFAALTIAIMLLSINVLIKGSSGLGFYPVLELRHFAFSMVALTGAVIWYKLKWIGFNQTIGYSIK